MTSLDRAVSLIKVDIVIVAISKHLEFNVARFLNVLLNDHMLIVKTLSCFSLCCIKLIEELLLVLNYSHAFASSTEGGLDDHWEPNFLGFFKKETRVLVVSMIAWHNWDISCAHNEFGLTLGSH